MTTQRIRLETKGVTDRESFFTVFSELMGFPDFFGRNWDAWIDCMRSVDAPDEGLSQVTVAPGELLHIEIVDAEEFAHRAPELFQHFMDCTAFVNQSRQQMGRPPVLSLILL
jgi:predicted N-formylglutamate amidohydrolase